MKVSESNPNYGITEWEVVGHDGSSFRQSSRNDENPKFYTYCVSANELQERERKLKRTRCPKLPENVQDELITQVRQRHSKWSDIFKNNNTTNTTTNTTNKTNKTKADKYYYTENEHSFFPFSTEWIYFPYGAWCYDQCKYVDALKWLEKALDHEENLMETYYLLGLLYYRNGYIFENDERDVPQALCYFNAAADLGNQRAARKLVLHYLYERDDDIYSVSNSTSKTRNKAQQKLKDIDNAVKKSQNLAELYSIELNRYDPLLSKIKDIYEFQT